MIRMVRIFTGDSVTIEVKPLVPGGTLRLVVNVADGIVEDTSADGTNRALTALTELHAEVTEAIDALVGNRARIADLSGRTGLDLNLEDYS